MLDAVGQGQEYWTWCGILKVAYDLVSKDLIDESFNDHDS